MYIKERAGFRIVEKQGHVDWGYQNLVFLDEVSLDNSGVIRKCGNVFLWKKFAVRAFCPFFNTIKFLFGDVKHPPALHSSSLAIAT
ncbi:hypothetical protein JG687_00013665 [Phytophthora cactorum]|uniref:Uncharacterized protein n=1 Tax=Phytophthora cactorum TaxID=29920 RepID=A0A8T1U1X3_9STRA|nr:hypothetical protein JG687_00013665 [Phytophthora cactorum]